MSTELLDDEKQRLIEEIVKGSGNDLRQRLKNRSIRDIRFMHKTMKRVRLV